MRQIAARLLPASTALLALSGAAHAQTAQFDPLLARPSIPDGFDRGRNVAVTEQPRPDYDPLGIPVGSFNVFPRVGVGVGATNNVFLTEGDKDKDLFGYLNPSVRVGSDWSRNQLTFNGSAQLQRYADETRRNQTEWTLGSVGRLDIGSDYSLTAEGNLTRQFETPFSGEVNSDVAVLSSYVRSFLSLRGVYEAGRGRATLAVDRTRFDFNSFDFPDGSRFSQGFRDRDMNQATGQVEYALSPSLAVFGQVAYDKTSYDQDLAIGQRNRDSTGWRAMAGVNFDLASFLRGTVGVGYTRRDYRAASFDDVSGVSVRARVEYFPSELTTYSLTVRRVIEDAAIGNTNAFFDNRATVRVDHALLRNLILNASAEMGRIDYIGTGQDSDLYRVLAGGRYLASRRLSLEGNISYGGRKARGDAAFDRNFKEVRAMFGVVLQP